MLVSSEIFKEAMGYFPSGVTIVTTVDRDGRQWGFTATAFSSLSLNPPMVLACLAAKADCKEAFKFADRFAVNVLQPEHSELAIRFATKGVDKFAGNKFRTGELGLPVLSDALVSVECKMENVFPGGDHLILTGMVEYIELTKGDASVYFGGKFCLLAAPAELKSVT